VRSRGEKLARMWALASERALLAAAFRALAGPARDRETRRDYEGAFRSAEDEAARVKFGAVRSRLPRANQNVRRHVA